MGTEQFVRSDEVAAIREQIDHPIIDGDGHLIEFVPWLRDLVVDVADESVAKRFDTLVHGSAAVRGVPGDARRELGISRSSYWALPARNTLDRATAMLPELLYSRLDEIGIDYALLYPTYGLTVVGVVDAELRGAVARACNRYIAEAYAPFRDRLEPVASIPMFTPEEAIAELHFAVGELGLKSVMMAGVVPRAFEGAANDRTARWMDTLGHDSMYDYDPVWQTCLDLGVCPTFHASGMGWGSRTSTTNYVYNHIGNFATAGEATARSLIFGGVTKRFPELRFAFLEGGVAWGVNLLADLIGHYEKRNRDSLEHYNPANLDRAKIAQLVADYGAIGHRDRSDQLELALTMLSDPDERPDQVDDFAESMLTSVDDILDIFTRQYFFGCEADDPMNAMAFDSSRNPGNAKVQAMFASDIGHWDVPDFRGVLPEAWELVDDGHITTDDFRAFTCDNISSLLTAGNPDFFSGTTIDQP